MGMPGGWELLVIVLVIVLLFGGKKIPELAKGLGKGIREFKEAVNEEKDETKELKEKEQVKEIENKKEQEVASKSESNTKA